MPLDRDDVIKVACPLPLRVPVPITVLPSLKVTVPVGVPVVADVTVAVKVTACPKVDGFGIEVTLVVVLALFTVCFSTDDVLGL